MSDYIDRQAVINEMKDMYTVAEKWAQDAKDDETKARAESCMATNVELKLRVEKLPSVQTNLQPTCNKLATDCIERQAAIDAVNGLPDCPNGFSGTYDKAAIIGILEDVPSVQPEEVARDIATIIENEKDMRVILANGQTGWIPVSEALPDRYIVGGDGKHYSQDVLMTVIHRDDDIFIDYGQMVDDEWYSEMDKEIITSPFEVVAWMPLPEPYKGEQE